LQKLQFIQVRAELQDLLQQARLLYYSLLANLKMVTHNSDHQSMHQKVEVQQKTYFFSNNVF
jgi:hypothetical protein